MDISNAMNNILFILTALLTYERSWGMEDFENVPMERQMNSMNLLSNTRRDQPRDYLAKFRSNDVASNNEVQLTSSCLKQFLNRFQPALDRENIKPLAESPNTAKCFTFNNGDKEEVQNRVQGGDVYNLYGNKTNIVQSMNEFSSQGKYKMAKYRKIVDRYHKRSVDIPTTQVCTQFPGKVMCKFGKYTYIINTKEHEIDNKSLERIVGMMHQRVSEGDKSFEVSITEPVHKPVSEKLHLGSNLNSLKEEKMNESPILVECTPVKKRSVKNTTSSENESTVETTYSCVWHNLKLKRNVDEKEQVISFPKSRTCSTALFVRKFSEKCTKPMQWCPETTLKPCVTTPMVPCIPWCNPWLVNKKLPVNQIHPSVL